MTVTEKALLDLVHEFRQLNKTMLEIGAQIRERNERYNKGKKNNEEKRDTAPTEV